MVKRYSIAKYQFLERHKSELQSTFNDFVGSPWSLDLPVFLFNRCWFRLQKIKLYELSIKLLPDNSQEAPELIRYYELLRRGHDQTLAVQECWHEYGMEDFHRALRKSLESTNRGNNSWTFNKYMELMTQYRNNVDKSIFLIPLIILGRNSKEDHLTEWVDDSFILNL